MRWAASRLLRQGLLDSSREWLGALMREVCDSPAANPSFLSGLRPSAVKDRPGKNGRRIGKSETCCASEWPSHCSAAKLDGSPSGVKHVVTGIRAINSTLYRRLITKTGSPRTSKRGLIPRPGSLGAANRPFSLCGAPSAMLTVT